LAQAVIQRLEAERRDARAQERAIAAVELARSIDEEVVMRALRRAGLVQQELRRSMKRGSAGGGYGATAPDGLAGSEAVRRRRSSSGTRRKAAKKATAETLHSATNDR
jgi:hypothetical protein